MKRIFYSFFFKNKDHIQRDCYLWNMIAGLINASEAVILLMVIRRTSRIEDAGILTLAFAVANLMSSIGKYGMRAFQVTDIKEGFAFPAYLTSRIATVILMIVASLAYSIYGVVGNGYSARKAAVVFCICLLYAVEALEDVFAGLYQQKGRLDVSGKMFSVRWSAALVFFSLCLIVTKDLLAAAFGSVLLSVILFVICLRTTFASFYSTKYKVTYDGVWSLLLKCTPLFVSVYCSLYLTNASKYAIDKFMSDQAQACYGFVAMPVFVIGLINGFLYQPVLVRMAAEWRDGDIRGMTARIKRQLSVILLISVVCIAGAYFVGVPALSLLYNTDLTGYKSELLILLAGGGILAAAGFFNVIMTIMRCQKGLMYGYLGCAALAKFLSDYFVRKYGTMGAAGIYVALIALLALTFYIMMRREIRRRQLDMTGTARGDTQ